jgi:hypothetical protein
VRNLVLATTVEENVRCMSLEVIGLATELNARGVGMETIGKLAAEMRGRVSARDVTKHLTVSGMLTVVGELDEGVMGKHMLWGVTQGLLEDVCECGWSGSFL